MSFRIGIDVGGTFTDLALLNEQTGAVTIAKSSTTPTDHVQGILNCLNKVEFNRNNLSYLVYGTTIVTNSIVQRHLPKVALITTKGFRDVLEMMRENRPIWGLYDIQWEKPKPIVPRNLRFEVSERIDTKGNVVEPLNISEVTDLVKKLRADNVETVAVCLISSFINPTHEKEISRVFEEEAPEILVSLSSEVNPQIREYERTSTTAIDAAVKPLANKYFKRLREFLDSYGFRSRILIMKSNGGLTSVESAAQFPVYTIESGPAGGTIGAVYIGDQINHRSLLGIDMGGTTFKVSVIDEGVPRTRSEGEVEWGITYRVPMIDISEIGSGGGSIAWIDREGVLRVGPVSAGAEPGPVCYGTGGTEPTFTDACVILGYTDPEFLLGGEMRIDRRAAEDSVRKKIAKPLGLDVIEAAQGIVEISNQQMLGSMRVSSVERGYDPRDFATIAYGGAGPMVGSYLAKELGSPLLIVPPHPGIFSAIGMLLSDIRLDFMRPFHKRVKSVEPEDLGKTFALLEDEAVGRLSRDFPNMKYRTVRSADMRYVGQNYDINAPMPGGVVTSKFMEIGEKNFAHEHEKAYGHAKGAEIEFVNLRVTIFGTIHKPRLKAYRLEGLKKSTGSTNKSLLSPPLRRRKVFFPGRRSPTETPVYERATLQSDEKIKGPCVVEEVSSTIVVHPGQRLSVDKFGNLLIET